MKKKIFFIPSKNEIFGKNRTACREVLGSRFAMGLIALIFSVLISFSSYVSAKESGKENVPPKDFSVTYEFLSGGPGAMATSEKYTVQGYQIIYERDFIPIEGPQDPSKKRKETSSYPITAENLNELWNLFSSYRFLDWSTSTSKAPSLAGNQTLTVKANEKTVSHSMWEPENEERFRDFSSLFLRWVKKKMSTEL